MKIIRTAKSHREVGSEEFKDSFRFDKLEVLGPAKVKLILIKKQRSN